MARYHALWLLALAPAISGCGGRSGLKLAPVSGVVTTKDGKPVVGATVRFQLLKRSAENAPTSSGKTDESGRFVLTIDTPKASKGAMIGKHRVTITKTVGDPADDSVLSSQETIAPKYNAESKIEFEVPQGGRDDANFEVELINPNQRRG